MGVVSRDLYRPLAALQWPLWGIWNGLPGALSAARESILQNGEAAGREKVAQAAVLGSVLWWLDQDVDDETAHSGCTSPVSGPATTAW